MDAIAWYRAGQSRARGQISVRHGFSVGPSLTDSIPHVSWWNRRDNVSVELIASSGCIGMRSSGDPVEELVEVDENRVDCRKDHGCDASPKVRGIFSISLSVASAGGVRPVGRYTDSCWFRYDKYSSGGAQWSIPGRRRSMSRGDCPAVTLEGAANSTPPVRTVPSPS